MSNINIRGGDKARPARKADTFTAICESTVCKMQDPWCLTTLEPSAHCYMDSFTFNFLLFTGES
jgi:hypothetical protein